MFAMSEEQSTLLNGRELCSFGSGTWYDGRDAIELMESDGPWLSCSINFDTLIILEKKQVLSHLQNLPCLDRAVTLHELLVLLEDAGEAPRLLLTILYNKRSVLLCGRSRLASAITSSTLRKKRFARKRLYAFAWMPNERMTLLSLQRRN